MSVSSTTIARGQAARRQAARREAAAGPAAGPRVADSAATPEATGRSGRRMQTRRRLVEAATALFAERGLHGVTSADIASRAGVATGTFYLHFKDKHELFHALVFEALDRLFERQDRATAQLAQDSEEERLARIRELVAFTEENRDLIRVVFGRSAESAAIVEEIHELAARDLEARFARMVTAGKLSGALHPALAAQAHAVVLTRLVAWWAHDPRRADREALIQALCQLEPGGFEPGEGTPPAHP